MNSIDPIQNPRLPTHCPACSAALQVARLDCTECDTAVLGSFDLPPLARLAPEDQTFVLCFLQTGGNLKDMAKLYGVSYPTLRNRLDALVEQLAPGQSEQRHLAEQLATQLLQAHEQGRFETLGPEEATESVRRGFTAESQRHLHQKNRQLFGTFEGLDFVETRFMESQPHLLAHRFKGRYGAASPEVRVVLDRDGKLAGLWIKPWQDQML